MDAAQTSDTIVAIATPPGRGGIGIVRLSGPDAAALADPLLRSLSAPLAPGQARFCHLVDPATGARLDSYTSEDVVEIAAHGSPVLLEHLLRILIAGGARLAMPGEFTERAFLSGRLDLTQAEAVRDLIDAQSLLQAQVAAQQLGGALSRQVAPLKAGLVALIAVLEAGIDFAEDDTPVLDNAELDQRLAALISELDRLAQSFARGRIITAGVTLAIVGRPNAGKSSLFNRLLERDRAIVTAEPGTTRDTVQERLSLDGIPVELIDTAGLRDAANEAERMGIEKSREAFADAGLVLLVLDATETLNEEERALLRSAAGRRLFIAENKCDLLVEQDQREADGSVGRSPESALHRAFQGELGRAVAALAPGAPRIATSARTGEGIAVLRQALRTALLGETAAVPDSALVTNLRQHTAVLEARGAASAAATARVAGHPHEVLLLDLYAALSALDALTGSTTPDDILNRIFSTFCIGK